MVLDLDNFKPLNDKHGHLAGDELLIEVANQLKRSVRVIDTVARFGGDEFVVVLGELGADHAAATEQALAVAEKIRMTLAESYQLVVKQSGKPAVNVEHHCTASVGVSLGIDRQAEPDEILKLADEAMYQAKKAGRNQVFLGTVQT
jgi:diguanylate cyclase (GGDEF)-like protein